MRETNNKTGKPPIVTHLTRVSFRMESGDSRVEMGQAAVVNADLVRKIGRQGQERAERIAAMMELLACKGFSFRAEQDVIYAYSSEVEAFEVKQYLLAEGFYDPEFQILLEYTRGWGML